MEMKQLVVNGVTYTVADPDAAHIDDDTINRETVWSSETMLDRLCPGFAKTGPMITCLPLEGYPMKVTTGYGWETIAKLDSEMEDGATRLRYTLEPGATYQVMAESQAEIYNVYAETVSGVNLPLQDVQILDTTATYRLTAPEDLQEDVFLFTSNGVSQATLTIRKQLAATKIFRTGKNLCDANTFDVTVTQYHKLAVPIPAGTYKISCDYIVSTDTETTKSQVAFYTDIGGTCVAKVVMDRGSRIENRLTLTQEVKYIYFYAAEYYDPSKGDTATFTNFMVSVDGGKFEPYQGGEFAPGEPVPGLAGENYLWADVGEISVTGKVSPVALLEKLM